MFIAISGKKGHGKDTVGKTLVDHLGFKREYFARPIKDALKILLNFNDDQVEGHLKEIVDPRYGITPREAMQTLGTEWGRNIHPDIWAITCVDRIKSHADNNWVITDLRFLNEASLIRKNKGYIIHVVRPNAKIGSFSDHQSEKEIDSIEADLTIVNDGSLDQLSKATMLAYTLLTAEGHIGIPVIYGCNQ